MSAARPSPVSARSLGVLALAVPLFLTACGDDGVITKSGPPRTETSTASSDTSSDDDASATTTTASGTDKSDTGTTGGGATGGGEADETNTDDDWSAAPTQYRGEDGVRVAFTCPAGGTASTVWGTGPFTDDSSVCTAAVYAGAITFEEGGRVVVVIRPGEESYEAGTANGVTTQEYGTWAGSFELADAPR